MFLGLVVALLLQEVLLASARHTCGSLITYRQQISLLDLAPRCLLNGCNSTNPIRTIESFCVSDSPCSKLWNLLKSESTQDWCASCPGDIACRIHGWPILNATAACQLRPNDWLFYTNGECCTNGNEPFELAEWVNTLCNGSEWRIPFHFYGGMAMEDWEEWIEPFNWTVRVEDSTVESSSNQILEPANCQHASLYLGLFALENFGIVILAVGFGFFRYRFIRWNEEKSREELRQQLHAEPGREKIRVRRGFIHWLLQKALGGNSRIMPVVVGLSWLGLELGANFVNAAIIHGSPGYGHVPLAQLALLFCSRPSIAFIPCFAGFLLDSSFASEAGQDIFADIAWSAALREFVMQVLGGIYLGRTGNIGRIKGFYLLGHLRPYWHGKDAYRMYVGALLWLIGSPGLVPFWGAVTVIFFAVFMTFRKARQIEDYGNRLIRRALKKGLKNKGPRTQRSFEKFQSLSHKYMPARLGTWISGNILQSRVLLFLNGHVIKGQYAPWVVIKKYNQKRDEILAKKYEKGETPTARWFDKLRAPIMAFMVLIGLAAYIAQWLFWDGLVKSMGNR